MNSIDQMDFKTAIDKTPLQRLGVIDANTIAMLKYGDAEALAAFRLDLIDALGTEEDAKARVQETVKRVNRIFKLSLTDRFVWSGKG